MQHAQLGEVGGQPFVGRRTDRRHAPDEGAGPLGPLEGELRGALLKRQPQPLHGQGPAVTDEGALEVEAAERRLPGVQLGQSLPDLGPGGLGGTEVVVQLGADLVEQQPGLDRRVLVDHDAVEAGPGVHSVTPVQREPRRLQLQQSGVAGQPVTVELGGDGVGPAQQGRARLPTPISASSATASARRAGTGLFWLR